MATPPHRRELFLDNGRVFVETPRLMTDAELAVVAEVPSQAAIASIPRNFPGSGDAAILRLAWVRRILVAGIGDAKGGGGY
jgi:hypothetical protein